MGNLIQLDRYKGLRRREYSKKYDAQITKFIDSFLAQNLRISYESLSYHFFSAQQQDQHAAAWDYVDFRDTLRDGFHEAFGQELVRLAKSQYWFDERFITADELVERCVSQVILGSDQSVAK